MKLLMYFLRATVGIGLLSYVLLTTDIKFPEANATELSLIASLFFLFPFIGAAIEATRLKYLSRSQDLYLSFANGYRFVVIGTLFGYVFPGGTGGDFVKLYYLVRENGGRILETATVLIIDRIVALVALLLLVIIFATIDYRSVQASQPVLVICLIAVTLITGLVFAAAIALSIDLSESRLFRATIQRLPFRSYIERVLTALYTFRNHKKSLLAAALLSITGHLTLMGLFSALASLLMPGIAVATTVLLSLLGMLANALPVTPGGVGVGEAAFEWLFALLNFHGGAQLILVWRIANLPICVLGSLLCIIGKRDNRITSNASGPHPMN